MDLPPPVDPAPCAACGRALKPDAAFCSGCGHRVGDPPPVRKITASLPDRMRRADIEWREIRGILFFYVTLLAVQIVTAIVVKLDGNAFFAMLVGDALMALVTCGAALRQRDVLKGLYSRAGFGPRGYAALIPATLALFLFVHFFVVAVHSAFRIREVEIPPGILERGLGWVLLFYSILPPIFEELAFRGVIFGVLKKRVRGMEALVISSIAFAILHLSVISLFTHVPMGIYLCWLRNRSNSLYPAMVAHFLHNTLFVANAYQHFLPG